MEVPFVRKNLGVVGQRFSNMKLATTEVELKQVVATPSGTGLFLGNNEKTFIMYVDLFMGEQIQFIFSKQAPKRPLTFDFVKYIFFGFDISVQSIVIYDMKDNVFFARVVCRQKGSPDRFVEMDLRPSDAILLSLTMQKPIKIGSELWARLTDVSDVLKSFKQA